jgi:hypothetical protein
MTIGPSAPAETAHPAQDGVEWPSVGVVITTRERPNLVRRALRSVLAQDYPGPMRVVVVVDDSVPDWSLAHSGARPVLVMENWHRPGVAGARNTGILAVGDCDWVALCDDGDTWAPGKLAAQVTAALAEPGRAFVTCGAQIEYDGRHQPRLLRRSAVGTCRSSTPSSQPPLLVTLDTVGRGQARRLPVSGFLARYDALARPPERGGIGLFAEDDTPAVPTGALVPLSGTDVAWDLLMRAARRSPIVHVDEPYVRMLWRREDIDPAAELRCLRWMAVRHPELRVRGPIGAHHMAEMACWEAVCGSRRRAWALLRAARPAMTALPRTLLALCALVGVVRGRLLARVLHRHRRGH